MNRKKTILLLCLYIPLFCLAQANGGKLQRMYEYDAAGNRTMHKVIEMNQSPPMPPDPPEEDSVQVTSGRVDEWMSGQVDEWYSEKFAQVEMKIYPNPATEKITFEILGNAETHGSASLLLYSLSGQLLRTQAIHSETTELSLVGLAKGTYILKVEINGKTEDWKIIKQ
jgi:hypothetical protein